MISKAEATLYFLIIGFLIFIGASSFSLPESALYTSASSNPSRVLPDDRAPVRAGRVNTGRPSAMAQTEHPEIIEDQMAEMTKPVQRP